MTRISIERQCKYSRWTARSAGFTVLELLVVVIILIAVAFVAGGSMDGVEREAQARIVRAEMLEISRAIKQFKADTGYYPGEGPFALLENLNAPGDYNCADDQAASPGAVDIDSVASRAWFESPANFTQLLEQPELCAGHNLAMLAQWDPNTGRGWRGPYLQDNGEGFVVVGDDVNPDQGYELGDPATIAVASVLDVNGVADPFEAREAGGLLTWGEAPGATQREAWGRPYLIFLNNYLVGGVTESLLHPRVVSMGPDGIYAGCDDINLDGDCNDPDQGENPCLPEVGGNATDDVILCLE